MLTRRQWAVIRAALQYFAEELGPHEAAAFRPLPRRTVDWRCDDRGNRPGS